MLYVVRFRKLFSNFNEMLKDCFETTDWQIFEDTADGNINELTDSVNGYIGKCIDDIIAKTTICK